MSGFFLLLLTSCSAATVRYKFTISSAIVDKYRPTIDIPEARRRSGEEIPSDHRMLAYLINDQYPGPTLTVDEGDEVQVTVNNKLHEGAAIHWHGILQTDTPYMDGAWAVTQCAIDPVVGTMAYTFIASPPGTAFYYGSVGHLKEEGIAGAIVVRRTDDPYQLLYDGDKIITISDWTSDAKFTAVSGNWNPTKWQGGLLNGQFGDGSDGYPYPLITINSGQCFRLRFINMASRYSPGFYVSISGHTTRLMALDGTYLQSTYVQRFASYPGERHDVIVCGDQTPGNYRITVEARDKNDGPAIGHLYAYLHYAGHTEVPRNKMTMDDNGTAIPVLDHNGQTVAVIGTGGGAKPNLNLPGTTFDSLYTVSQYFPYNPHASPIPDRQVNIFLGFKYSPSYPNQRQWFASTSMTPYEPATDPLLYTKGTCGVRDNDNLLTYDQPTNLEIIFNNLSDEPQPVHLHGHRFYVMGTGFGFDNSSLRYGSSQLGNCDIDERIYSNANKTGQPLWILDKGWGCPYNATLADLIINSVHLHMLKDTVLVPPRTWAAIRIRADRPGMWSLNSQIVPQQLSGMTTILSVMTRKVSPVPDGMPRCGICTESQIDPTTATRQTTLPGTQKPVMCTSSSSFTGRSLTPILLLSAILLFQSMRGHF